MVRLVRCCVVERGEGGLRGEGGFRGEEGLRGEGGFRGEEGLRIDRGETRSTTTLLDFGLAFRHILHFFFSDTLLKVHRLQFHISFFLFQVLFLL